MNTRRSSGGTQSASRRTQVSSAGTPGLISAHNGEFIALVAMLNVLRAHHIGHSGFILGTQRSSVGTQILLRYHQLALWFISEHSEIITRHSVGSSRCTQKAHQ